MSVPDARISVGLPGHPKTKKLLRRLGGEGGWALVRLILFAAQHRPDGDLAGMSDEDIELAVDWPGEEGLFVKTLLAAGFLEGAEGDRALHDWHDWNPWAAGAEQRSHKARWLATRRHHGEAEADRLVPEWAAVRGRRAQPQDASGMQGACGLHAEGNAPSPSPSPIPSPSPTERAPAASAAGLACRAMRDAGCTRTNPAHADLLAALEEGVTADALASTVAEGLEAGKAGNLFAWAIATARGRHAAGARPVPEGAPREGSRKPSLVERIQRHGEQFVAGEQ